MRGFFHERPGLRVVHLPARALNDSIDTTAGGGSPPAVVKRVNDEPALTAVSDASGFKHESLAPVGKWH
jgi:hypothetical protein